MRSTQLSIYFIPGTLAVLLFITLIILKPNAGVNDSAQTIDEETDSPCAWTFDPTSGVFLTSDLVGIKTQETQNCYAWQTFIALNWPVDPGWPAIPANAGLPDRNATVANWGVPVSPDEPLSTTAVWTTYKAANDIFLADASVPTAWGVVPPYPSQCSNGASNSTSQMLLTRQAKSNNPAIHNFAATGVPEDFSDEIMEASGGWLTDQNQNLVYFNRRVGKAEFEYILENKLYIASEQLRVASNADNNHPSGLSLPTGSFLRRAPDSPQAQEDLGAIEIKAAWKILGQDSQSYARYLTTTAWLQDPDSGDCTEEAVGLVGLHIIHKTASAPDFIWATFEHIDNVPIPNADNQNGPYSFFNPECTEDCTPNVARIDCDETPCKNLYPKNQPVQVTRDNAIPAALVNVNNAAQQQIASNTGGKSVFQYYQLVNVLWDQSPTPPTNEPGAGATVPLHYGDFTSEGPVPVANTTMETYVQTSSCIVCHESATIAGSDTLASDFSFLFETASEPTSAE